MNDEQLTDTAEAPPVRESADDIPAVQAVVCILLAAGLFCTELISPSVGAGLHSRLAALITDTHTLFPDPLGLLLSLL